MLLFKNNLEINDYLKIVLEHCSHVGRVLINYSDQHIFSESFSLGNVSPKLAESFWPLLLYKHKMVNGKQTTGRNPFHTLPLS